MIYLDNNATTKLDPRVLKEMMPFFTDMYGNAASNHAFGASINQFVKKSRGQLAETLLCDPNEVIFTSGATEAINVGIKGVADAYSTKGKHIVTVASEHPAVLDTCRFLEEVGFSVTYLSVESDGLINLKALENSIRTDTTLVTVMLVNNETGVIQPIKEISELAHKKGALLMTDATQAVGKMAIDVDKLGIDLLSFSAHKFYGPKGIGGLFIRSRRPNKVKIRALIHGGGHERGLRSGTLNVPAIVGIGKAAEIAIEQMSNDSKRIGMLRDILESELLKIENSFLNGNHNSRLYNTTNICFKGADADAMMVGLKDIIVSNGSACTSTKVEPSHVLKALGRSDEEAYSSIRFSLGRFNTKEEILKVVQATSNVVSELRLMLKQL
jgi:cysteine desulfurase